MHTIALLYTERSGSERDLGLMITHLESVLTEVDGVKVTTELLTAVDTVDYGQYEHLVFCGYDYTTLGHIHLAMAATETSRITLYDEPGAAIDRELGAIIYRAIDLRRAPGSSATRLVSSWSHRDIVATAKQDVLRLGYGASRHTEPRTDASPTPARSGGAKGASRARKVDVEGAAQARKRNETARGEVGDSINTPD